MIGINMQINKLRAAGSQPAAPTPGTEYPSQSKAYQPFVAPAPVPAATDNSAKLAELTAEMQACATNDDFTRAMELQEEVGHFFFYYYF